MQRVPRPGGTVEVIVSPTDFVLETEPRHEQATARRMLMPLQERQVLLLKSSGPMVFDLILDEWLQSSRWDEAIFHDSRHFVPGAVPPGQKHPPIEAPCIILSFMGLKPWEPTT
jgi:hypothetical protein